MRMAYTSIVFRYVVVAALATDRLHPVFAGNMVNGHYFLRKGKTRRCG
jgi:hypothetical protein